MGNTSFLQFIKVSYANKGFRSFNWLFLVCLNSGPQMEPDGGARTNFHVEGSDNLTIIAGDNAKISLGKKETFL